MSNSKIMIRLTYEMLNKALSCTIATTSLSMADGIFVIINRGYKENQNEEKLLAIKINDDVQNLNGFMNFITRI